MFSTEECAYLPRSTNNPDSKVSRRKIREKSCILPPFGANLHQQKPADIPVLISHWPELVLVQRSPGLEQLYLSRVGGEEQHDGEACQQPGVLDGKGEEEAAAAGVLLLTTHLIHLWKLRSIKQRQA